MLCKYQDIRVDLSFHFVPSKSEALKASEMPESKAATSQNDATKRGKIFALFLM